MYGKKQKKWSESSRVEYFADIGQTIADNFGCKILWNKQIGGNMEKQYHIKLSK